jgi:hypothetical protein
MTHHNPQRCYKQPVKLDHYPDLRRLIFIHLRHLRINHLSISRASPIPPEMHSVASPRRLLRDDSA